MGDNMENLKIYEIENSYVDYLVPFAPHLVHDKKEKQENGGQLKKNVVCQPEHITITSSRKVMTRGVPAEYYFPGDNTNSSGEFSFLKALKIDIANAVKNGIPGKNSWEGSKCFLVAENNE